MGMVTDQQQHTDGVVPESGCGFIIKNKEGANRLHVYTMSPSCCGCITVADHPSMKSSPQYVFCLIDVMQMTVAYAIR